MSFSFIPIFFGKFSPKFGKKTKTCPKSIAGDKKEEPAPAKLPEALIERNCIGITGLMAAGEPLKAAGILLIALSALDVGKKHQTMVKNNDLRCPKKYTDKHAASKKMHSSINKTKKHALS